MDLSHAIQAKSDQLNAIDLIGGPQTFQIERVEDKGRVDQPIWVHLVGHQGRPWKPSKTALRLLTHDRAWGVDGDAYAGRWITLYRDPEVTWGGEAVGGIQISAMSHIESAFTEKLNVARHKRKPFTVQKLEAPAQQPLEVPADIQANAEKAATEGQLPAYKAWLNEQGAPAHIMEYIDELGGAK
ncbi:hypothetical protein ACT3UQ_08920 [Glutamicibacter sp. AOP12-B1-11]|uniref:hypothetical protein n=1 Tax=Glutamicibacter sp. AOP12-B1-11 TaxID=3457725 RepID=UPI004033E6CA